MKRKRFTELYGAAEYRTFGGKVYKLLKSDFNSKSEANRFVHAGDIINRLNYYRIIMQPDGWYAVYIRKKDKGR